MALRADAGALPSASETDLAEGAVAVGVELVLRAVAVAAVGGGTDFYGRGTVGGDRATDSFGRDWIWLWRGGRDGRDAGLGRTGERGS